MLVLLLQLQQLQLLLRNFLGYHQAFFLLTGVFLGVWNHENRFPEANIAKMVLATTPLGTSGGQTASLSSQTFSFPFATELVGMSLES